MVLCLLTVTSAPRTSLLWPSTMRYFSSAGFPGVAAGVIVAVAQVPECAAAAFGAEDELRHLAGRLLRHDLQVVSVFCYDVWESAGKLLRLPYLRAALLPRGSCRRVLHTL